MTENECKRVQTFLKEKGFYDGLIDGKIGPQSRNATVDWAKSLGVNTKGWTKEEVLNAMKSIIYTTERVVSDDCELSKINTCQLAFIRGVGATESGFRMKEAYSERYNKSTNNVNVRKYGTKGGDYGYYQTNGFDVEEAIRLGVPKNIAIHLNGGGKGGISTIAQQTRAMHEYLLRKYPEVYEALKLGGTQAFETARKKMFNHWFGLKDSPAVARAQFKKAGHTAAQIFPEVYK
jgi:hypothetical protein